MARIDSLGNFLTDVADAIRTKKGTNETILASDFDTEIENLPSGGNYNALITTNGTTYAPTQYYGIKSLITEIKELDITNLINNISYLFAYCSYLIAVPEMDTSAVNRMEYTFFDCQRLTTMPAFNVSGVTSFYSTFDSCSQLTSISFNNTSTCSPLSTQNMFNRCNSLTHIDLRDFDFSRVTGYTNMFGASATNGVPDNCEIIVADDTQKTWITSKFSRLTNVKTVAEYEAEQNS